MQSLKYSIMTNLPEREQLFKNDVEKFTEYPQKIIEQFFNYWSEPNKSATKMKWELEKTWDTKRRLKRWFDNQKKWNGNNKTGTSAARIETARKW